MSFLPTYQYHIGSKQQVFEGIKIHLKNCKEVYDNKREKCNTLYNEMNELKRKIEYSFKKDIETINILQKEYDAKHSDWLMLTLELKSNESKFYLDMIDLFID